MEDLFGGFIENWVVIPEGNGKTTWLGGVALYGADYSLSPWIPIGAASRKQASILFGQAAGFVERTPGLNKRFRVYGGYLKVASLRNGGRGIEVYAADDNTGDGVIPYPYALVDEPHRMKDLKLYRLWKGKLRKRNGQIIAISTAGEPGTEFEETRDEIRNKATDRDRSGAYLRAAGAKTVMHEWMVRKPEHITDMDKVAEANPLSLITAEVLQEQFDSPTTDMGDWARLKCNRPTKSASTAITDMEWDARQTEEEIPEGVRVSVGCDIAWKWDCTALVPFWMPDPHRRVFGNAEILTPPRDGTALDPLDIRDAFERIHQRNPIERVVIDPTKAEETSRWLEDELGVDVVERGQSNRWSVDEYDKFMEALSEGWIAHTGHPGLRSHVLNAVARPVGEGQHKFDRPTESRHHGRSRLQNRKVIDALKAAAMVHADAVTDAKAWDGPLLEAISW